MDLQQLSSDDGPIEDVVTTSELHCRPSRAPDFEAESQALNALVRTFATSPRQVLQKVADLALQLCDAHSAGVSLLEDDGGEPVFRWCALAGAFEALRPDVEEALLVPFHLDGAPLGTIWVMAHDPTRRFDGEDARIVTSLGQFAAAACHVLKSQDALEASIAERREQEALAVAADRSKDRFIAIVAHELRDPLTPIRHAAAALRLETLDVAATRQTSEIIERQVLGMTRLIDDLLDVSRIALGTFELQRAGALLNDIILTTVAAARDFVSAHRHSLIVDVTDDPILIDGDAMRLSQVLRNLITNAAKYTNPGGEVRIELRRDGEGDAVLTVSDTGIGIAPAQIDAIFELYAQAGQAATPRSEGGLGIGLYLAQRLIEAHGGSIRATSAGTGGGSEFVIRLPCIALASTPAAHASRVMRAIAPATDDPTPS